MSRSNEIDLEELPVVARWGTGVLVVAAAALFGLKIAEWLEERGLA